MSHKTDPHSDQPGLTKSLNKALQVFFIFVKRLLFFNLGGKINP